MMCSYVKLRTTLCSFVLFYAITVITSSYECPILYNLVKTCTVCAVLYNHVPLCTFMSNYKQLSCNLAFFNPVHWADYEGNVECPKRTVMNNQFYSQKQTTEHNDRPFQAPVAHVAGKAHHM